MKTAVFLAALAGLAFAAPQAVTSDVAPDEKTPEGCQTSYSGKFQVVVQTMKKRSIETRQSTPLEITLKDGVMTDAQGRTGYIASNNQFQFDGPAQAGAIYTAGWSVCGNGSIALGNSAIFYQCLSGTFYNLYDENDAQQCSPVYLNALGSAATTAAAGAHTVVCQIGDGQIQQDTCITTAIPPTPKPTGPTITQISDGQIQAPGTSAGPTAPVVQAPTGPVVSQISDGQPQAPTAGNSTIASPSSPVPTAPAASSPAASAPATFSGLAAPMTMRAEVFGLAAGVAALLAL